MKIVVFVCVILVIFSKTVVLQQILVEPSSRLVPVGTEAFFKCVISNAQDPHWKVNNTEASTSFQKQWLSGRGFFIAENEQLSRNTTLRLRVDSSYANVNNTKISCRDDHQTTSSIAHIMTINGECIPAYIDI